MKSSPPETPEQIAQAERSHTGKFLREGSAKRGRPTLGFTAQLDVDDDGEIALRAAEEPFDEASNAAGEVLVVPKGKRNGAIHVHGAREHNLKNIDLKIPREQLVVITGLSALRQIDGRVRYPIRRGQRRFLDSMSPYARQFVERLEKPDVDLVSGLPPTVAIEQRVTRGGGKSTVATVTEVYHFLAPLVCKNRNAVLS